MKTVACSICNQPTEVSDAFDYYYRPAICSQRCEVIYDKRSANHAA